MARYAATTDVSPGRSVEEIERTLRRYGAEEFVFGTRRDQGMIEFVAKGRRVRFVIELPDATSSEFTLTETGRERASAAAMKAWEQACRQRWRALALFVKASLEAIESGIVGFDELFLAHMVLPNGATVGQAAVPVIDRLMEGASVPSVFAGFLPAGGEDGDLTAS